MRSHGPVCGGKFSFPLQLTEALNAAVFVRAVTDLLKKCRNELHTQVLVGCYGIFDMSSNALDSGVEV